MAHLAFVCTTGAIHGHAEKKVTALKFTFCSCPSGMMDTSNIQVAHSRYNNDRW